MRNERGLIRGLFLIILAAIGCWYVAGRWWPQHNFRKWSGEIEAAVNAQLLAAGVYDHQVLSQVHKEQGAYGFVWIESDRRIQVDSAAQIADLSRRLQTLAHRKHCQFDRTTTPDGVRLEIHQWIVILQRVTLVRGRPTSHEATRAQAPETPQTGVTAKVALVIDDVAYDMDRMDNFAALGVPLTFAILPRDRHTRELAEKAALLHFPVILHLPMEPLDLAHNNPGGAALYLHMRPEQLREQFDKDVASVPHIVGINNHMGSAFTENFPLMSLVMHWVKKRGLFFLDSRTSLHSIVPKAAREAGVACRVNETFLDNSDTAAGIELQLDQVMKLALRHHTTIAIGHYRRKHLVEALANKLPEFRAKGIALVGLPTLYGAH